MQRNYESEFQEIQTTKNPPLKSALKKGLQPFDREDDDDNNNITRIRLQTLEEDTEDKLYLFWIFLNLMVFSGAAIYCFFFVENPPNDPMNKRMMLCLINLSVVAGYSMGLLGYSRKSEEYTKLYRLVLISQALFQIGIIGVVNTALLTALLISEPMTLYCIYKNFKLASKQKEYEKLKKEARGLGINSKSSHKHKHQHTKNCRH
mmetsp:Transcript_18620/g.21424  ORF Transcript_18620/g.21424 Transcript_18620/m.21424 type:complete len:205 (+) Transcript_18620:15-629(+)